MSASSHVTTPKDIRQAASALEGVAVRTNLERSERLSAEAGVDILLKREDQQKCRSFKVRGAYARMSLLSPAERERGVVCASAGNHAQGLAYACAHLGVRGTIYLPSNTPRQKRRRIATIGGASGGAYSTAGRWFRARPGARTRRPGPERGYRPTRTRRRAHARRGTGATCGRRRRAP